MSTTPLTYEQWYNKHESEINIMLAETGADRELDFDSEREFEDRYELYLNTYNHDHDRSLDVFPINNECPVCYRYSLDSVICPDCRGLCDDL